MDAVKKWTACLAWLLTAAGCAGASYEARGRVGMVAMPLEVNEPVSRSPAPTASAADAPSVRDGSRIVLAQGERAPNATIERKVVYTAWFTVDVYEIREAQKKLVDLAKTMGGYMQETRGPMVVIRVPAEKFEQIEPALRMLGRVDETQTSIRAQDVTEQYYDVELRLATKKKYLQTLSAMLESAGELKDKLAVQKEIARVVEEIESLEGRLRVLSQQVSLATVTVTFRLAHSGPKRTFRLPWDWLDWLGIENLIR